MERKKKVELLDADRSENLHMLSQVFVFLLGVSESDKELGTHSVFSEVPAKRRRSVSLGSMQRRFPLHPEGYIMQRRARTKGASGGCSDRKAAQSFVPLSPLTCPRPLGADRPRSRVGTGTSVTRTDNSSLRNMLMSPPADKDKDFQETCPRTQARCGRVLEFNPSSDRSGSMPLLHEGPTKVAGVHVHSGIVAWAQPAQVYLCQLQTGGLVSSRLMIPGAARTRPLLECEIRLMCLAGALINSCLACLASVPAGDDEIYEGPWDKSAVPTELEEAAEWKSLQFKDRSRAEIHSVGISLKSEDWRTQVIIGATLLERLLKF
ncbi:hypothetical protein FQN60_007699 [Etheostoma spectabile]|uniref:Uncharacterized protein n=1 Tax=Etheostoma spectabile TaxID=54343 RepID=A0A5J5CZT4_9PERO|nr:hypothetical protein FQN60_007699 [Etheostoma spectabile]